MCRAFSSACLLAVALLLFSALAKYFMHELKKQQSREAKRREPNRRREWEKILSLKIECSPVVPCHMSAEIYR